MGCLVGGVGVFAVVGLVGALVALVGCLVGAFVAPAAECADPDFEDPEEEEDDDEVEPLPEECELVETVWLEPVDAVWFEAFMVLDDDPLDDDDELPEPECTE